MLWSFGDLNLIRPVRTPSTYGDLPQSSVQVLHDSLCPYVRAYSSNESRRSYSRSYLYTFTPLFVSFTKSLHFSLSTHITFTSLSFSDLALNAFLTRSRPASSPSTSNSYTPSINYSPLVRYTCPNHCKTIRSTITLFFYFVSHQICDLDHSPPPILHSQFVFITSSLCFSFIPVPQFFRYTRHRWYFFLYQDLVATLGCLDLPFAGGSHRSKNLKNQKKCDKKN